MSIEIFDIETVITYLKTQTDFPFGLVDHAWDLDGIPKHEPAELPAALLFVSKEHAGDDGTDKKVSDKATTRFKVHLVCPVDDLTAVKKALRQLLIGWCHDQPAGWDVIRFLGADMIELGVGLVRWEEEYYTWRIQRAVF